MRAITLTVSLLTAVVVIALLGKVLPNSAAAILLDINRATYPFTVQNILWLAFFAGLGELSIRWRAGRLEAGQIDRGYLPEDEETVLRPGEDLTPIFCTGDAADMLNGAEDAGMETPAAFYQCPNLAATGRCNCPPGP